MANEWKAARERLTLIRLFEELRGRGYGGGYDAVRRYAGRWSKERGQSTAGGQGGAGIVGVPNKLARCSLLRYSLGYACKATRNRNADLRQKGRRGRAFPRNSLPSHCGAVIPEPDATHVYWLLERHPEAAAKIGVGVKEFSTRNAMFNTRCFEVRRTDGTTTDFSFKPCLDGKAPSTFAEALRVLRAEVTEDTKQMKWGFFRASKHPNQKVPCALSGRLLTLDEAAIDHVPL